ncbi:DUF4349 domain-containing protein [Nostocoides sp. F2B08]|uniref:DUF4349 domain-containing protein n=1 Tax=Nostocoides sp. F2B08 TaxID=2653936 RepID=UPI00126343E1|nr:DUF4349 domain-containing protein [Tetrasphaera sp. F2B08]KAB7742395.1 DUF4349 domain-containing protein [Tetrasphaera sp. F2B08]
MRIARIVAVTAAAAALLTGCSGSTMTDSGGDSAEPGVPVFSGEAAEGGAAAEDAARSSTDPFPSPGVAGDTQYQVREASLGIKVDSIGDAAARVRQIASDAGGSVTSEQFGDVLYGPADSSIERYGTMTISVPSEELDATLDQLSGLGEVRTRSSNAYDVEDEYVDVEARIATLEASIARMRDLMEQTEDVEQIVSLETSLSERQADLDSLQARLNSLQNRIAMSPVFVTLTTTDDLGEPDDGIVGALKDAWDAFTRSAALLITTVGALLPWLLVVGLAGWLLLVVVRRVRNRRRHRSTAAPTRTPDPASKDPATTDQETTDQETTDQETKA